MIKNVGQIPYLPYVTVSHTCEHLFKQEWKDVHQIRAHKLSDVFTAALQTSMIITFINHFPCYPELTQVYNFALNVLSRVNS